MTTEPVRAEVVAQFLKENPRYLELGLEVEAAVGHLRKKAKKDLWEIPWARSWRCRLKGLAGN